MQARMLRLSKQVWKDLKKYKNRHGCASIDAVLRDLIAKANINQEGKIPGVDQIPTNKARERLPDKEVTCVMVSGEVWQLLMRYKVNYFFNSINDVLMDLLARTKD